MLTTESVLQTFRDSKALLDGHFELRSGLHSNQFFQCALLLQHPRLAEKLCASLAEKLSVFHADSVISPAMGGLFVGHEIGRALGVRHIFAEKQDNRLVLRRGFQVGAGEKFIVAEDVMTRGGRIQETIDIVHARGGIVSAIAVIVDRSGGKVSFACPVLSLVKLEPVAWAPAGCPLCKAGQPVEHPGS